MPNATNLEQWVRDHKKAFAESLIEQARCESQISPAALFMAGLPGAGKTEFTKALIQFSEINFLRLDMDEIATRIDAYRPENADQYRRAASALLDKTFDLALNKHLNFIMDGTFSHHKSLQNVTRAIKRSYVVKVIYLIQDPKIAWEFTQAREKVEHRAINQDGFITSYFNIQRIIQKLLDINYPFLSVDCAVKSHNNRIISWHRNISRKNIDEIIKSSYNKDILKDYLNGHNQD